MTCKKQRKITGIYAIKNTVTGKYYVGSAKDIKKRWYEHKYKLKVGKHHSLKLQRSYDKHGINAFEFVILKEVSENENLLEIEEEFIQIYQAWANGYNVLKRGAKLSEYPLGTVRNLEKLLNGEKKTRAKREPTKSYYISIREYQLKKAVVQDENLNKSLKFSVCESYRDGKTITRQVVALGSIHLWQLILVPRVKENFLKDVGIKLTDSSVADYKVKLIADFNKKISKYDPTANLEP